MITRRLLLVSFALLATGIGLLAGYCNGTAGFDFSDALSGNVLKVNITTAGYPMIFGLPITLFGSLLLIVTVLAAGVGEIRFFLSRRKQKKTTEPVGYSEAAADLRPHR